MNKQKRNKQRPITKDFNRKERTQDIKKGEGEGGNKRGGGGWRSHLFSRIKKKKKKVLYSSWSVGNNGRISKKHGRRGEGRDEERGEEGKGEMGRGGGRRKSTEGENMKDMRRRGRGERWGERKKE